MSKLHKENITKERDLVKKVENPSSEHGCACCAESKISIPKKQDAELAAAAKIESLKQELITLSAGALLFAAAILLRMFLDLNFYLELSFFLIAYLTLGGRVVLKAGKNILQGQVFDENFLMSIATMGAFAIGDFPEAVAVMLFYQIGELFQDLAACRSKKSIAALMDIRPDYANLKTKHGVKKVKPDDIQVGDIIVIKPGEKIPLDGIVISGQSMLDTSALTGESVPCKAEENTQVLSGCINQSGLLTIEVTKTFGESTVSKIIDLVENASSKKAPTENFITTFARYYTPVVVGLAALLAVIPPLLLGGMWSDWITRGLIFLVVSCPCALVISIPLSFFGGIGCASKRGILVKGSNYLEALNKLEIVAFDKTGTLTEGVFEVVKVSPVATVSADQLLETAAYAESYSSHPIALYIQKAYGKEIQKEQLSDYTELPGHGIKVNFVGERFPGNQGAKATLAGEQLLAGNEKLMQAEGIAFKRSEDMGTKVYVAKGNTFLGYILISDKIRPDSTDAIAGLKAKGIKEIIMLTGDNKKTAGAIAKELGIDAFYAELLPDQKLTKVEALCGTKSPKGKLAFVGDGINDAPVLAGADIGIAMGGLGSDAAIEAADIVLMTDEPSNVVTAVSIAGRTKKIVWQNIIFALGIKGIILILGAFGFATMWEAVFADVGVAVLAILNAMRMLKLNV